MRAGLSRARQDQMGIAEALLPEAPDLARLAFGESSPPALPLACIRMHAVWPYSAAKLCPSSRWTFFESFDDNLSLLVPFFFALATNPVFLSHHAFKRPARATPVSSLKPIQASSFSRRPYMMRAEAHQRFAYSHNPTGLSCTLDTP